MEEEITRNIINPIALIFSMSMGILMLILRRRFALLPFIVTASYVTLGQFILVAGAHITMLRVLILFGVFRVIARGEYRALKLINIDKAIIWWIIANIVLDTLLYGTAEAFINRMGYAMTCGGSYFIARAIIRDEEDVKVIIRSLALILLPIAVAMLVEKATHLNIFAVFGGVPLRSLIRDAKWRSQGPFMHPILAGTFGATFLPLLFCLYWEKYSNRILAIGGLVFSIIIVWASGSSGPASAVIIGMIALFMWPLRYHMKLVRWMTFIFLIVLQLVMTAPAWFLIGKLGHLTGGSGWHRSELIDSTIRHFSEWWLIGTTYTRHWMVTGVSWSTEHTDITNMFIRQGVDGGILTMLLFIMIIVTCYKGIGQSLRIIGRSSLSTSITLWCMGSALTAHVASFISVAYFDQMLFFWHLLLAMISSVVSNIANKNGNQIAKNWE